MPAPAPILLFDDVHRRADVDRAALTGLRFAVAPAEIVGLVGANGAGKTTLLELAVGLLAPDAGTVRTCGLDPRREPVAVKRRIGFVSERMSLPGWMRLAEMLALHRHLYPTWDAPLAAELVARFSLDPRTALATMRAGDVRRAAMICAVAHRPALLLLDEPAGGLDAAARRALLDVAVDANAADGAAIVLASHHLDDVERIAGRTVVLDAGRVVGDSAVVATGVGVARAVGRTM